MPRLTPDQQRLIEANADIPLHATLRAFQRQGVGPFIEFEELHGYLSEEFCLMTQRFNGTGSFRGYAMARLWFKVIDYLRENGPRTRAGKSRPKMEEWHEYGEDSDQKMITGTESKMRDEDRDPGYEDETVGWEFFKVALDKLSERERSIMWMRYVEGRTLWEIGDILGVTESRISQIESAALRKLRRDPDVIRTAAEVTG